MSQAPDMQPDPAAAWRARHRRIALGFGAVALAMVGLSYAAVPLYKIFCQKTGFAGTPRVAEAAPATRGKRKLVVRFDANVAPGLPWSFTPETGSIVLQTGKTATVFFKATNQSNQPTAGQAAYNISPDVAGGYFDKIACFCFSEQRLDPGETAEMPVVFFLDPALEQDETMANVGAVTLSYTFFAAKGPPKPVADAKPATQPKL
jgi:cytochrome c oxidase assembly protein subunit 11